jgi:uncharacterized membrane protein YjjB (DUF3815 family)
MLFLLVIYNALTPTFIIVAFIEYCGWTNYIWILAFNEEIVMVLIKVQLSFSRGLY